MNYLATRYCALAAVALGLQCQAAGISGTGTAGTPSNDPPAEPLPPGCEFIDDRYRDTGGRPRRVSQREAGDYAHAVADVPFGRRRTVRFLYLFGGLQKVVPAYVTGDFIVASTEVTVFKGDSTAAGKASVVKFSDGTGNVMLPVTSVVEGPGNFQNLWAIQLKSTGLQIDPPKSPRHITVTVLCPMPIEVTKPTMPTLTR